jgi:uncharacterized membrane protein YkvA (DUF1232 family)
VFAIYLAVRDPRVPWYARALGIVVVGYAFSPIDLIPDPIPILGYLDDLILIPLGIALLIRWIPPIVLEDSRQRAKAESARPVNWLAAAVIVSIWLIVLAAAVAFIASIYRR